MEPIIYEKLVLPNGLEVVLHEDHSLPLTAVNIWYHVGSKDETPGKTGYAHLFEHIMFEGSKHHNHSHFDPLQKVGATLNGSTTTDRTNYWETLPSNYLELALWLESDRMGFLLDALDQKRFDIQRDVVKNERRQSYENRPYGIADLHLQEALHPLPHPYHWPTIGYHEDLDVATLDDAHQFFQRFYSPSNASLAIAGDFNSASVKEMVHRYFSDLPPGPPLARPQRTDSTLLCNVELSLYDQVQLPRLTLAWPTIPQFHRDAAPLSLLATIMASGKSSRLYKRLVYEKRIAQTISAHHAPAELTGSFEVEAIAAAGINENDLKKELSHALEDLLNSAPTGQEMEIAKNRIQWRAVRQMSRIGGFGGKADNLNAFNVFGGDPGLLNEDLRKYLEVQSEDVSRVAKTYLSDRRVQLVVLPQPKHSISSVGIDRTKTPPPQKLRPFSPPAPVRATLQNGLNILMVEKRGAPMVAFSLLFDAGAIQDPIDLSGLTSFTTGMLQEGTLNRSSADIAQEFDFMGTRLFSGAGRERIQVGTEALLNHWPRALDLIADLLQNPSFPENEIDRIRTERLTSLKSLRDDAAFSAMQLSPMLVFGKDSSYGHPILGTEKAVESFNRANLINHFKANFGPKGTTLLVVGDITPDEVIKRATASFGDWENKNQGTQLWDGSTTSAITESALHMLDKPGAAQSVIRLSSAGIKRNNPDYFALILLNDLFGGQFTSRLNLNLRQDKGYSYGFHSGFDWYRDGSLIWAGGSVQSEVTKESIEETLKEFRDIGKTRQITRTEFKTTKEGILRMFPSGFETLSQILDHLGNIAHFKLPDDYYSNFTKAISDVTLSDMHRVAQNWVNMQQISLLMVGDLKLVEPQLANLGLPLITIDHEGNT